MVTILVKENDAEELTSNRDCQGYDGNKPIKGGHNGERGRCTKLAGRELGPDLFRTGHPGLLYEAKPLLRVCKCDTDPGIDKVIYFRPWFYEV